MSLTSWLTDYIFTPASITFRDFDKWGSIIAILITFLVSGIWHGANWTFVLWGFLYGCYFIPLILKGKMNKKKDIPISRKLPTFKEFINIAATFLLVMFTFVIFRSDSIGQAFGYYKGLFSSSLLAVPVISEKYNATVTAILIVAMLVVEWLQRDKPHALQINFIKSPVARVGIYYAVIFIILLCGASRVTQFIYFKF